MTVDCPYGSAPGTVIVRNAVPFTTCPAETGSVTANVVRIAPPSPPVLEPTTEYTSINGMRVIWGHPQTFYELGYQVPSLGAQIDASGPLGREILNTLSRASRHH